MADKTITLDYSPYPHQVPIHEAKTRFVALMQPVRSGKDYASVAEAARQTINRMQEWASRTDVSPKWNIWAVAPTMNPGGRQLWADLLRVFPRELIAKVIKSENIIYLKYDGRIQLKSADEPEKLVSEAVDLVLGTECGIWDRGVWPKLRPRLSSEGRFGNAILNGTPQGQADPKDPKRLHFWWRIILNGRNPDLAGQFKSFYWFEDKLLEVFRHPELGVLAHPILSRTPAGRQELIDVQNDPDVPADIYRQDWLGECLPVVAGRRVTPHFDPVNHIDENITYIPTLPIYISLDFSPFFPFATFHQVIDTPMGKTWHVLDEYNDALDMEYMLDEDFIEAVLTRLKFRFPNAREYFFLGDHAANKPTDHRRDTTAQMMKKKFGISFRSRPTQALDEKKAIDIINGHLKFRTDQTTALKIHPRCIITVRGFQGGWVFPSRRITVENTSYEGHDSTKVAEIHPHIDTFDTMKYMVMHVIKPDYGREFQPVQSSSYSDLGMNFSESGLPISNAQEESFWK